MSKSRTKTFITRHPQQAAWLATIQHRTTDQLTFTDAAFGGRTQAYQAAADWLKKARHACPGRSDHPTLVIVPNETTRRASGWTPSMS